MVPRVSNKTLRTAGVVFSVHPPQHPNHWKHNRNAHIISQIARVVITGVLSASFSMQCSRGWGGYRNSPTPSCCSWISLPPLWLSLQQEEHSHMLFIWIHCYLINKKSTLKIHRYHHPKKLHLHAKLQLPEFCSFCSWITALSERIATHLLN